MSLKQVQTELANKKYPVGKIDGWYGPITENAMLLAIKAAPEYVVPPPLPPPPVGSVTGKDLLNLAATRLGETYVFGAHVPLQDKNWHGPWDCAEFVTWDVYQLTGVIYGCVNNAAKVPDPYTGGWAHDAETGRVLAVGRSIAAKTPGGILLRYRQGGHHIVFSCGDGTTIEAKGAAYGVCRSNVGSLASWDYGIFIPHINYS
jgi:N-acetylmuramoyl-L-alanine amidase